VALRSAPNRGLLRCEVLRPGELPPGEREPVRVEARGERDARGRWLPGAIACARQGGKALRHRCRLAADLGIARVAASAAFKPYRAAARRFRRAECRHLRQLFGAGELSPAVQSMVASAALLLAASRFHSDRALAEADPAEAERLLTKASTFADRSRQALLTARELASREGQARAARRRAAADAQAAEARAEMYDAAGAAPNIDGGTLDGDEGEP